ncbi:hypothetical protein ACFLYO_01765 [Chloroflexota bacterium]
MQKIAEKFNRSQRLEKLLSFISGSLANYRGVPILIGVGLIIVSLFINVIAIISDLKSLYLLGAIILHCALLLALIGFLLAEPLGRG